MKENKNTNNQISKLAIFAAAGGGCPKTAIKKFKGDIAF